MRVPAVLLAALLVPLTGCLPDSQADQCSDWTRDVSDHENVVYLHVTNERASTVCVQVSFAGEAVTKVPLQPAEGEHLPQDARTLKWPEPRITVRLDEWSSDRWTTETVDLTQRPHLEITVLEDDLRLRTHEQAP